MKAMVSSTYQAGRRLCLGILGAAVASAMPALAQTRRLRIASTFVMSGIERPNGAGLLQGVQACFNAINKAGGIHGGVIEHLLADDEFNPEVSRKNAIDFAADKSVLAVLMPVGTRQTAAVMDAVRGMAIVAPNTGTAALRKSSPPNVFWVRASYDQEVDKLVRNAVAVGATRIGIVYPDDPLGKSVFEGFRRSMEAVNLQPVVVATTPSTSSPEIEPAVQAIVKASPQVVVMALAGIAPLFMKALRDRGGTSAVYGLSIAATAANVEAMGSVGRGVGFALVVPSPFSVKHEIVRRYQADMQASGWSDYSLPSIEGYINARVLAEGLRRAGPGVSREGLIAALEGIDTFDLGGFRIRYGPGSRVGSTFVDVGVLGENGRIVA